MTTIGDNIRNLRKERNLTQSELAKEIGISRNYLSELENNKRNISTQTLKELSEKLKVSMTYLLEGKKTIAEYTPKEQQRYLEEIKLKGSRLKAHNELDNDIIKGWLDDLLIIYDVESATRESNTLLFNTLGFIEHFEHYPRLINKLSDLIYEMVESNQPSIEDKFIIMDRYYNGIKEMLTEIKNS